MIATHDPQTYGGREALRRLAAETLAADPYGFKLPPALGNHFEATRALTRSLELRATARIGVVVYIIGVLAVNFLFLPRTNLPDVAMQVTITPVIALLIASLFFRPDTPKLAREVAATVATCCFSLATVLAVACSPPAAAQLDFGLCCLPVMYVLAFCRLHFIGAMGFALFSITALAVALLTRGDVAVAQRIYAMCLMLAAVFPVLAVLYRLEVTSRNFYLRSLLNRLSEDDLDGMVDGFDDGDARGPRRYVGDYSDAVAQGVPADPG